MVGTLERADRAADPRHRLASRRSPRRGSRGTPLVIGRPSWHGDALSWRSRHYDLAINFEGDIRTHVLPWLAGAGRRVGFAMAGGGPLLTDVVEHAGGRHVAANSLALVERAFGLPAGSLPDAQSPEGLRRSRLVIPEAARSAARAALTQAAGGRLPESLLAVHVPGGRAIKQWPPARFADAACVLATRHAAPQWC